MEGALDVSFRHGDDRLYRDFVRRISIFFFDGHGSRHTGFQIFRRGRAAAAKKRSKKRNAQLEAVEQIHDEEERNHAQLSSLLALTIHTIHHDLLY